MRIIFALFLLMFFAAAHAQVTTNVYFTQKTNLPVNQTIYYNTSVPLKWLDFEGLPNSGGIVAAITMSGFGYQASMKSSGGEGELNVAVYCYFNKPKSWVKPDKKTAYILNHEQHHFDVSFIASKIFVERVKAAKFTAQNINTLLPKIYKDCCDIMNKMQDDYDGQTKNGQLAGMQEKWDELFVKQIKEVTK